MRKRRRLALLAAAGRCYRGRPMKLREYQDEAVEAIIAARGRGLRRVLISMPTGLGKTVLFSALPERLGVDGLTLVLAHRDDLLAQALRTLRGTNERWVDLEKASHRASPMAGIVVASQQTLATAHRRREFFGRLVRPIELVVVDEAHHALSRTYTDILADVRQVYPDALIVGVTATPSRGDGKALRGAWEEIVYHRSIRWAIEEGWLVPISAYVVRGGEDLSGVSVRRGDFVAAEVERAVDTTSRNERIVAAYLRHTRGKPAVVFCTGVAHAHHLAEIFNGAGVAAQAVDASNDGQSRREIYEAFREGKLRVLLCADLLSEGWDETVTVVVAHGAPTRSQARYIQRTGRALRPIAAIADQLGLAPDAQARRALIAQSSKPGAIILDVVDDGALHSLVTAASLAGLPPALDLQGAPIAKVREAYERVKARDCVAAETALSLAELEVHLLTRDPFSDGPAQFTPPPPWERRGAVWYLRLQLTVDAQDSQGRWIDDPLPILEQRRNGMARRMGRAPAYSFAARSLGWQNVTIRRPALKIAPGNDGYDVRFLRDDRHAGRTVGTRDTLQDAVVDAHKWLRLTNRRAPHNSATTKKRAAAR